MEAPSSRRPVPDRCGGGRCRQGCRGHGEESRELSQLNQVKHSTLDRRVSPVPGEGQSPGDLRSRPPPARHRPLRRHGGGRPGAGRRAGGVRRGPGGGRRGRAGGAGAGAPAGAGRGGARRGRRSTSAVSRTTRAATWRRCCSPAPTAGWRCSPSPASTRCGAGTPRPGRCPSPPSWPPARRCRTSAAALVVDVAGPVTFVVEGDDLRGLAAGWTPARVGGRAAWIGPAPE